MSQIITASVSTITLTNKNMMLVKEHHYNPSQPVPVLRPNYEPYDEIDSYGIDLTTGEVRIVRPRQSISVERGVPPRDVTPKPDAAAGANSAAFSLSEGERR